MAVQVLPLWVNGIGRAGPGVENLPTRLDRTAAQDRGPGVSLLPTGGVHRLSVVVAVYQHGWQGRIADLPVHHGFAPGFEDPRRGSPPFEHGHEGLGVSADGGGVAGDVLKSREVP